jgi:hypothetical protein
MLEELVRKQRERDKQIDELNAALKTLRASVESQQR